MKIVLIDDEKFCNEVMETLLQDVLPQARIVGIFERADEALFAIPNLAPDLIFLDINMPFINGFELLDRLTPFSFKVIFTTAYDSYAIKAFKYGALDYILKPVAAEDLKIALAKALINFQSIQMQDVINKKYKIAIRTDEGILFKPIDQIIYCESEKDHSRFHFTEGKSVITKKNLSEMEETLKDFSFFRIHRDFLINLSYVDMYIKADGGHVVVSGKSLPVAGSKKDEFNEQLEKHML